MIDKKPGETRQERTGWRDEGLSQRHRLYGSDCPAVDVDFLVIEYETGKAVALIEYKNERAAPQDPNSKSYKAIIGLCNDAQRPFFAVRYKTDFSEWYVVPLNSYARKYVPDRKWMTEEEYVSLLYHLRDRDLPNYIRDVIRDLKKEA